MHKNSTLQVYFGFFNLNTPYLPLFQAILIIIWYTNSPFHLRLPVKKRAADSGSAAHLQLHQLLRHSISLSALSRGMETIGPAGV